MTTMNIDAPRNDTSGKKAPRYLTVSAWAVPVLILTGWAFITAVPVALIAYAAWRDTRVRALRWWASLLVALYAIPTVQYITRSNPEDSMSDLLHPGIGVAIAAVAVVILVKIYRSHRG